MEHKLLREKKIGNTVEQVYKLTRKEGNMTINDVLRAKKKWLDDGKKKFKAIDIGMIKVVSGEWVTFHDDESFNAYFENKVKDPSKFYEFPQVEFYVTYEV